MGAFSLIVVINLLNRFEMRSPLVSETRDRKNGMQGSSAAVRKSNRVTGLKKFPNIFRRGAKDKMDTITVFTSNKTGRFDEYPLLTPTPRRSPRLSVVNSYKLDSLSPLLDEKLFPEQNRIDPSVERNSKGHPTNPKQVVASYANTYMRSNKPFPRDEVNREQKILVRTGIRDLNALSEEFNSKATIIHSLSLNENLACCGQKGTKKSINKSSSSGDILANNSSETNKRLFKKQVHSSSELKVKEDSRISTSKSFPISLGSSNATRKRSAHQTVKEAEKEFLICEETESDEENVSDENVAPPKSAKKDKTADTKDGKSKVPELKRTKSTLSRKIFGSLFDSNKVN